MGCRKVKQWSCDLSGDDCLPEDLEGFAFVFDGVAYSIDLSDEHAAAFRQAMAPYVQAARKAATAEVLRTIPRRPRHLRVVPAPPQEETPDPETVVDPVISPEIIVPDGPKTLQGEESQALSEGPGLPLPEASSEPANSPGVPTPGPVRALPDRPRRPALSVVPPQADPIAVPAEWARYAPLASDSPPEVIAKARGWATIRLGYTANEPLTSEVRRQHLDFYAGADWLLLEPDQQQA